MASDIATESPRKSPRLWDNRDFRKFWFGETLSLYGTQVSMFAVPTTALLLNAGPAQMGLLRAVELLPYLLFALVFGVWVDRVRLRPVLIWANLTRFLLIGAVPIMYWAGVLNLPLLLVIAFAVGTASVLFDVTWMSYLPVLIVDRRFLVEANAKLGISASSADAAGPGVAGLLVQVLRAPYALVVNSATYLVSLISLLMIRSIEPVRQRGADRRLRTELAEGLRFVFGNPTLRGLALIGFACNFVITGHSSLFLLYAVQSGLAVGTVGGVLSVGALGGVLGAALARRVINRFPPGPVYNVAFGLVFIAPVLIPAASGPQPLRAAMFVGAYLLTFTGMSLANVLVMSLRQTLTPTGFLGRMNSAMRTLLFGGGALGGLLCGLLASSIGLRPGLWLLAIGSALVIGPVVFSPAGKLRDFPDP